FRGRRYHTWAKVEPPIQVDGGRVVQRVQRLGCGQQSHRRPLLWSVEPDGKPGARLEVVPAPGESGTGPHRSGTGAEETGAGHRAPTPTALDPRTLGEREERATVKHRGGRRQATGGTADKRKGETSIRTERG